jgi:regulator of cell morphogenesis and NO signaling
VDYILSTHHAYINNAYPYIVEYTQKVSNVHGEYSPETVKIAGLFFDLMNELHSHMEKEEMLLFPYIRQLAEAKRNNNQVEYPGFGTVRNPVRMMEHEHDVAGEIMRQISQLSNNYIPPAHACTTFRLSYAKLQEFEEDLHKHIHLENNILFPKAIELEQSILN